MPKLWIHRWHEPISKAPFAARLCTRSLYAQPLCLLSPRPKDPAIDLTFSQRCIKTRQLFFESWETSGLLDRKAPTQENRHSVPLQTIWYPFRRGEPRFAGIKAVHADNMSSHPEICWTESLQTASTTHICRRDQTRSLCTCSSKFVKNPWLKCCRLPDTRRKKQVTRPCSHICAEALA